MALANLQKDSSIQESTSDFIGGGSYLLESGVYDMTIETAYLGQSKGGATSLNLQFKGDNNENLSSTIYVTSGTAKGGLNTYLDKEGKKQYLPGFVQGNDLCLLAVGKDIGALDTTDKVVKVYSYEKKADVPTNVAMLMDLIGSKVKVGVIKQTVDKNVKNDAGQYVPSGEFRDENEINLFFHNESNKTVKEILAKVDDASFIELWKAKWDGVVRNRAKGIAGSTPGAPQKAAGGSPSLFD